MWSIYFKIFSASLLITFLSPGIATSINMHVPFLLTDYDARFIIIIIISFIQGIYTYIPETNHVPREYSVSATQSLLFMVSISLVPALALL